MHLKGYWGLGFRVRVSGLGFGVWGLGFMRIPQPVIVAIVNNKDYIRVLFYSYDTTITGWGVLVRDTRVLGLRGSGVLGFSA